MTKSHAPRRVIHKLRSAFPTEWRGEHSGVEAPGQFVGRNQKEWKQLWDAAHSNMYPIPKAPKLPKDKIAVAIFHGQTGDAVTISVTDIRTNHGTTTIQFETAGRETMATVQREPYLLKFIERTDNDIQFHQKPAATPPAASFAPKNPPF